MTAQVALIVVSRYNISQKKYNHGYLKLQFIILDLNNNENLETEMYFM